MGEECGVTYNCCTNHNQVQLGGVRGANKWREKPVLLGQSYPDARQIFRVHASPVFYTGNCWRHGVPKWVGGIRCEGRVKLFQLFVTPPQLEFQGWCYPCTVWSLCVSVRRIPGMKVSGETFSPIQHLQLAEPSGDRKLDCAILQNIVVMVSGRHTHACTDTSLLLFSILFFSFFLICVACLQAEEQGVALAQASYLEKEEINLPPPR